MSKHILISIIILSLLFTGCSSNSKKQKPIFSEEQQSELKDIFDRNLTDEDWDNIQQKINSFEKLTNSFTDIDIKNDFDKDPLILMLLLEMPHDNPNLQKELSNFMNQMVQDSMKSSDKQLEGQVGNIFK